MWIILLADPDIRKRSRGSNDAFVCNAAVVGVYRDAVDDGYRAQAYAVVIQMPGNAKDTAPCERLPIFCFLCRKKVEK